MRDVPRNEGSSAQSADAQALFARPWVRRNAFLNGRSWGDALAERS